MLSTAGAVAAFAPDLDTFDSGRNFAAWLGLVPRQRSPSPGLSPATRIPSISAWTRAMTIRSPAT